MQMEAKIHCFFRDGFLRMIFLIGDHFGELSVNACIEDLCKYLLAFVRLCADKVKECALGEHCDLLELIFVNSEYVLYGRFIAGN